MSDELAGLTDVLRELQARMDAAVGRAPDALREQLRGMAAAFREQSAELLDHAASMAAEAAAAVRAFEERKAAAEQAEADMPKPTAGPTAPPHQLDEYLAADWFDDFGEHAFPPDSDD